MASTRSSFSPPNFILTPQQQGLLFAALTSNGQNNGIIQPNALSMSPSTLTGSPAGSKTEFTGAEETPFLDFDYDFGPDASFDFDFGNTTAASNPPKAAEGGEQPEKDDGSSTGEGDTESPEKRGHPEDEPEEGGGKRRESAEKVAKKPGRKPLTSEPSSKRKAQNRAAQRAFRERKEKHLRDLEAKVQELEKSSEAANQENSVLRAKLEKVTVELNEYKKRLSMMSSRTSAQPAGHPFGHSIINNLNDVNFHFEFPKFGTLPGPTPPPSASSAKSPQRSTSLPSQVPERKDSGRTASAENRTEGVSPATSSHAQKSADGQLKDDLSKFSGVFSPPLTGATVSNASRSSVNVGQYSNGATSTSSPSASSNSNSNMGPSSSCGTSPEPFTQSPMGFKPVDTMTPIGEEQTTLVNATQSFGAFDSNITSFDWLSQQNGGQFDPQLFTAFREPQENILANATFDDSFFNDAFDMDFTTPYNMAPSPLVPKRDLIAEIDAQKESEDYPSPEVKEKYLTCNKIWEKLQACPKVQSGEFDLDGLCSELQKKAKCSGNGAVVDEAEFKMVVSKYLGKDEKCASDCSGTKAA